MKTINKLINKTSIRPQLFITVAVGIVFLLIALILASTWVANQQLRQVLIHQGEQATANLAKNSVLALLYDSPENATAAIDATLAFPGVTGVAIYKADGTPFYRSDKKLGQSILDTKSISISEQPLMIVEDEVNWQFSVAVTLKSHDSSMEEQLFNTQLTEEQQLIGYVLVISSKESLKTIGAGILFTNSVIALIVGLLILFALHKNIRRLTQSLYYISDVMKKAEQGDYTSHISTNGPLEVHHIASAYNQMITVLIERDYKLRKQNIHLEKQATNDYLTGLMNRIGFEQALNLAIEECQTVKVQHALCYIDLDKFKIINDSCGHNAGDEILKNVSEIFKRHIRKDSDTLARVGGDEFTLILKNCSIEKASAIAENICTDIESYRFTWNKQVFSIGVSIGVTLLDETSENILDVVSKADSACYVAKEKGRGQVHVIRPGEEEKKISVCDAKNVTQIIEYQIK